jgi:DNA repair protein RadC
MYYLYMNGHRSRAIQKFFDYPDSLLPVDLLELILFVSINRRDTREIAWKLYNKFGSLRAIFNAPVEVLMSINGIGRTSALVLKLFQKTTNFVLQEKIHKKQLIAAFEDLIVYCQLTLGTIPHEQLKIIYLDTQNQIIKDEIIQNGATNFVTIDPKYIIKRAIELSAMSIVLVHNHPSQCEKPSKEDIICTNKLLHIFKQLDIHLQDHLVVTANNYFSFKQNGLI